MLQLGLCASAGLKSAGLHSSTGVCPLDPAASLEADFVCLLGLSCSGLEPEFRLCLRAKLYSDRPSAGAKSC